MKDHFEQDCIRHDEQRDAEQRESDAQELAHNKAIAAFEQMSFSERESYAADLIAEYLGDKEIDEDAAGLSQDLSVTDEQLDAYIELYENNRAEWLKLMIVRASVLWEEKIIERVKEYE